MNSVKLLSVLFCLLVLNSCTKEFGVGCFKGDQTFEVRMVELSPISKIEFAVDGILHIEEGVQKIEIEAPSEIIDHIVDESELSNGKWTIKMDRCYTGPSIIVRASLPQINALIISGSGDIKGSDTLRNIDNLDLEIAGSGSIDIDLLDASTLDALIAGSGNITATGRDINTHDYRIQGSGDIISDFKNGESCRMRIVGSGNMKASGSVVDHVIEIEGSGNASGFGFCSETCTIRTQGSGDCQVKVSNTLNVKIEGSGDVCYRGQPIVNLDIDGSGKVQNCN